MDGTKHTVGKYKNSLQNYLVEFVSTLERRSSLENAIQDTSLNGVWTDLYKCHDFTVSVLGSFNILSDVKKGLIHNVSYLVFFFQSFFKWSSADNQPPIVACLSFL